MEILSCIVVLAFKCKILAPLICVNPLLQPPAFRDETSQEGRLRRAPRPLSERQLRRIRMLVEAKIASAIPIARLSSELKMSPSYFSHCFKATTGVSPHAFVARCKMRKAAHLLAETECPLEQIAEQVGFSNMGHFRRQFRKYFGRNPSDLRLTAIDGLSDCHTMPGHEVANDPGCLSK